MINIQTRTEIYVDFAVDESIFTEGFIQEFREGFYDLHTLDDHLKHIGGLLAQGLNPDQIEGYPDGTIKYVCVDAMLSEIERKAAIAQPLT